VALLTGPLTFFMLMNAFSGDWLWAVVMVGAIALVSRFDSVKLADGDLSRTELEQAGE